MCPSSGENMANEELVAETLPKKPIQLLSFSQTGYNYSLITSVRLLLVQNAVVLILCGLQQLRPWDGREWLLLLGETRKKLGKKNCCMLNKYHNSKKYKLGFCLFCFVFCFVSFICRIFCNFQFLCLKLTNNAKKNFNFSRKEEEKVNVKQI